MKLAMADRFWPKVDRNGDCWIWTAARNPYRGDYGIFWKTRNEIGRTRGCAVLAHRVAWELTNGVIPDGMLVLHRCDNPPCVRPDHLFLGTDADNQSDMTSKGRRAAVPRKFTPDELLTLESLRQSGMTITAIAQQFSAHRATVAKALRSGGHLAP